MNVKQISAWDKYWVMLFSCLGVGALAEHLIWRSFTHGDVKARRLCYCSGCWNSYMELRWIIYWDWNYLCFIWITLLVVFCTLASCSVFTTHVDLSTQEFTKSGFWGNTASKKARRCSSELPVWRHWSDPAPREGFFATGERIAEVRSESVGWINAWQLN